MLENVLLKFFLSKTFPSRYGTCTKNPNTAANLVEGFHKVVLGWLYLYGASTEFVSQTGIRRPNTEYGTALGKLILTAGSPGL